MEYKTLFADNTYADVLCSLPVDTSPGNIITYKLDLPIIFGSRVTIAAADIIDFQLLDEHRNVVDLNGLDWSAQFIFLLE
jgi:hypothetical protein